MAIDERKNEVIAIGDKAKEMIRESFLASMKRREDENE